jgi:putative membrane protein
MPLIRTGWFALALAVLALAWLGPLPALARYSFAAHMTMHIAIVAVAAPLLALAMAGTRADPVRALPRVVAPLPASMIELVVVWSWHVPAFHHAASQQAGAFAFEQASFMLAGVLLWIAAIGGDREQRRLRAGAGVVALLFTSMHMTLLGALFALANRALFQHTPSVASTAAIADQHLGGVIMLLIGGASYLLGGLYLTATALKPTSPRSITGQESTV